MSRDCVHDSNSSCSCCSSGSSHSMFLRLACVHRSLGSSLTLSRLTYAVLWLKAERRSSASLPALVPARSAVLCPRERWSGCSPLCALRAGVWFGCALAPGLAGSCHFVGEGGSCRWGASRFALPPPRRGAALQARLLRFARYWRANGLLFGSNWSLPAGLFLFP